MRSGKKNYEIRLWGVDCPEYNQPYAREAKAKSKEYLLGKRITVEMKYRDSYERYVGVARQGADNINELLVRDGAAWVYKKYCREPVCTKWKEYETKARESMIGLWQQENPVPPWKWRRRSN